MLLQGDLQAVFEALYQMGAIDPVLKADWKSLHQAALQRHSEVSMVIERLNLCRGNRQQLVDQLHRLDSDLVQCVAMEVAREFADFADRKTLH